MATKTFLSVEDYLKLEEPSCTRYELSEGELIVTPSPNYSHNRIRDHINGTLRDFAESRKLGEVVSEMDFRLGGETVRRPDIAFICAERLPGADLERVPFPVVPDLVVEIVSKTDRADDLLLKVTQYLAAGVKAVWLFYPNTRLAYRYLAGKLEPEVRSAKAGHAFDEPSVLPGFSIPLSEILP
jgi:Uma2 family endonuclease